jgi:hypothetical protein
MKLMEDAHQACPYSKATRGNIEVVLSANWEEKGNKGGMEKWEKAGI